MTAPAPTPEAPAPAPKVRRLVSCVVGAVVGFFQYLDGLWRLRDRPLRQCLHDKAAKTVVIRVG